MVSVKAQATGKGPLSIEEFARAEKAIICFCQRMRFPDELACLQNGGKVKKNSHLYRLDPVLEDDVLRVGGRLDRVAMPDEARHPAILAPHLYAHSPSRASSHRSWWT